MQQEDFILKSGAKLHMSMGPWEHVVALWSAVKMVSIGKKENPEVGSIILASPEVQKAVRDLFSWATYDSIKIYPGLFDEAKLGDKARMDYLEICERLIEFNLRPFFLMTSSVSTDSKKTPIANPEQP